MGDKYGYLANPGSSSGFHLSRKWLWLLAAAGAAGIIWWLIIRRSNQQGIEGTKARIGAQIGKLTKKQPIPRGTMQYRVTAPVEELHYEGAGMPFAINYYAPAPEYHVEIDNMGIGRIYSNYDGLAGGIVRTVNGQRWFVTEDEWNLALQEMREVNADTLLTSMPYAMVGPGYLAYVTAGPHIGETVYVTLTGQIGRALYRTNDGELMFVPLDVIDQKPDIWNIYAKGGI